MEVYTANEDDTGKRIDQWLNEATPLELSRSRIKQLILGGAVTLNGVVVKEPKKRVADQDEVSLILPPLEDPDPQPEDIPLVILFEDDDLIVLNKPSGLVVHPGAGTPNGTLVNALLHHCGDTLSGIGGVKRPGIVHRLDKETSGVMVVAKNDKAHRHLSAQFADHGKSGALRRVYQALVWGAPQTTKGTIDTFLGRSSSDRTKQAIVSENQPDARRAVTHFEVTQRFGGASGHNHIASLIACSLETGRTHQIRVHMAHMGHPLIGDYVYGAGFKTKIATLDEKTAETVSTFKRQALHAGLLAFEHPTRGEMVEFTSEPPQDMAAIIDAFTGL
ncbi:MAG: RluA family pseudouridine synthase [Pseudomonadota bacterium]